MHVLLLGAVNSPHMTHLAEQVRRRGVDVSLAGYFSLSVAPAMAGDSLAHAMPALAHGRFGLPARALWLRRLLRRLRPDVVHAHSVSVFAWTAALVGASPLVSTAWGSDVYGAGRAARARIRYALRRSAAVTADSRDLLQRLVDLGARPETSEIVGWGVDLRDFSLAEGERGEVKARLGLAEAPVVLSPRALRPVYNPETILAAFARVRERIPDAQLVLKHLGAEPPRLAGADGPGVHVVGHVPYERMRDYYRAADVCVSIPASDSSPRSVWEAMACGCPCVLSDLPWLKGVLEPGRDALIVPIDPDAVAGAVEQVLADRERAAALGRSARAFVERHEDQDVHMRRTVELYERVVGH